MGDAAGRSLAVLLGTVTATGGLLAGCGGARLAVTPPRSAPVVTPAGSPRRPSPTTPAGPAGTACERRVAGLPLAARAGQLLTVPVDESDVTAVTAAVRAGAGAVILYGASAPADLAGQLRELAAAAPAGLPPLVMVDEEGGGVQRVANLVGSLPWPRTMAATMTPGQVTAAAEAVGTRLRQLGIGMDLAPVLDLDAGPGPDAQHPDGARSFSADPAMAAEYGLSFAAGLAAAGVTPVAKHFPGIGSATGNTDVGPARTPALGMLEQADLIPFRLAVEHGLTAVMVSNAVVPGLTTGPASLSAAAVALLHRFGFAGLVLTDSLSAGAVSQAGYSVPVAAVRAVQAGADLVLYGPDPPSTAVSLLHQAVADLVAAVGTGQLPVARLDQAVAQVLAVKGLAGCRLP